MTRGNRVGPTLLIDRTQCRLCSSRLAAEGYLTCDHCGEEVRGALDDIVRLYAEVPGDVDDPDAGWLTTSPTTGRRSPGYRSMPPINLDEIDSSNLRCDVLEAVAWWAGHVRLSTGLAPQTTPTVLGEIKLLVTMWSWIRRQEPVVDFGREMLRLRDALRRATRTRRIEVGQCPQPAPDTGTGEPARCGQKLYALLGERLVKCPRCGTPWPALHWEKLAKAQETR